MERFLQYLFDGLSEGAVYALIALGLVIVYRGTGHLNFAQGEMAMMQRLPRLVVRRIAGSHRGWPCFAAALTAGRPRHGDRASSSSGPSAAAARSPSSSPPSASSSGSTRSPPFIWKVHGARKRSRRCSRTTPTTSSASAAPSGGSRTSAILAVMLVTVGLLYLLFQKTKFGLAMRAVASNPESAPLVGIKTGQVLAGRRGASPPSSAPSAGRWWRRATATSTRR